MMIPDNMKQTEAGFKKNCTPLLNAMKMQTAPITIRNRLKMANMAEDTAKSAQRERRERTLTTSLKPFIWTDRQIDR